MLHPGECGAKLANVALQQGTDDLLVPDGACVVGPIQEAGRMPASHSELVHAGCPLLLRVHPLGLDIGNWTGGALASLIQ